MAGKLVPGSLFHHCILGLGCVVLCSLPGTFLLSLSKPQGGSGRRDLKGKLGTWGPVQEGNSGGLADGGGLGVVGCVASVHGLSLRRRPRQLGRRVGKSEAGSGRGWAEACEVPSPSAELASGEGDSQCHVMPLALAPFCWERVEGPHSPSLPGFHLVCWCFRWWEVNLPSLEVLQGEDQIGFRGSGARPRGV